MVNKAQIKEYRSQLRALSLKPLPAGKSRVESERKLIALWRDLVPDKPLGRRIYESFSDEELLAILKEAAGRLGYAPAQSDIFCFYRTYIKHRFVTWPAALKAAGLSRALDYRTGRFPEEEYDKIENGEPETRELLIRLAERWVSLGYPPKRREFSASEALKQRFGNWAAALSAAEGFEVWQQANEEKLETECTHKQKAEAFSERDEACLRDLKDLAGLIWRTPLKTEVREQIRCRLRIYCGSWNSVLRLAGLAPLEGEALERAKRDEQQRRKAGAEALFRISDLEPEYVELLKEIEATVKKLNRAPLKEEIAPEKRKKLLQRCGSWRNVLYQIDVPALTRQEAANIKIKNRKQKASILCK
ncbi:MAG TPA: hypothetical protein PKA19_15500 [Bacillota bacterium]|nr:hypothetical protein [Bacillota bacterium]